MVRVVRYPVKLVVKLVSAFRFLAACVAGSTH